jgi:hypothetical protein
MPAGKLLQKRLSKFPSPRILALGLLTHNCENGAEPPGETSKWLAAAAEALWGVAEMFQNGNCVSLLLLLELKAKSIGSAQKLCQGRRLLVAHEQAIHLRDMFQVTDGNSGLQAASLWIR